MAEHHAEASTETHFRGRRQVLKLSSIAVYGALAIGMAGCTQEHTQGWKRPDWMRSKQGSSGGGRGRR
ncbi:MAG: hypothetical protein ACREE7_08535 [Dongiaceae bacterium]